jgi:hypothetical protein
VVRVVAPSLTRLRDATGSSLNFLGALPLFNRAAPSYDNAFVPVAMYHKGGWGGVREEPAEAASIFKELVRRGHLNANR